MRTLVRAPLQLLYAVWTLCAFLGMGTLALLMLLVLPRLSWRRVAARALARAFLHLAGMPLAGK